MRKCTWSYRPPGLVIKRVRDRRYSSGYLLKGYFKTKGRRGAQGRLMFAMANENQRQIMLQTWLKGRCYDSDRPWEHVYA